MKIYGNESTSLKLTGKAAAMYAECDPLQIIEQDDGSYSLRGIEDRDDMTAADVNEWLEDLADDTAEDDAGVPVEYFEQAVELMDDEIREEIHASGDFDDDEEGFLREYERRHFKKYGEHFMI